jgi:hypothetical protein
MPVLIAIFFCFSAHAQTYHYKGKAETIEVKLQKKTQHTVYSKVVITDKERVITSTHCTVEVLPACKMSMTKIQQVPNKGWSFVDGRYTCPVTLTGTIKDLKEMVCAEKLPNGNTIQITYQPSAEKDVWKTVVKDTKKAELGTIIMVLTSIPEQEYNKAVQK